MKHRGSTMKQLLLRVLEWEAGTRGVDPWHIGIRNGLRAPDAVGRRLELAFGRYHGSDARRAFLVTMSPLAEVSRIVARRVGLRYPEEVEAEIRRYAEAALDA